MGSPTHSVSETEKSNDVEGLTQRANIGHVFVVSGHRQVESQVSGDPGERQQAKANKHRPDLSPRRRSEVAAFEVLCSPASTSVSVLDTSGNPTQ